MENIETNYFLSNFIKESNDKIIPTGELDWNYLQRNDTIESIVGGEITISSELNENNYLFDENLVGLWHFNDKNSQGWILNSATNNRDGQLYNGADVSATGLWDTNAGYFDGTNDYVSMDVVSSVSDRFTVSAWIYPTRLEPYQQTYGNTIVATSSAYGVWLLHNSGKIRIYAFASSTAAFYETAVAPVELNKWQMITVSAIRNGEGKVYFNGELIGSFVASDSVGWQGVLGIGDLRLNRLLTHKGNIEEVTIWNRALDEDEVSDLYESQKANYADSLIGLWHLNDNAEDSSGNNNHGSWSGTENYNSGLWNTNSGYFDGSSYIDVTGVITDSSWSLSVWLNPTDVSSNPKVFDCESGRLVFEYAAGYWRVWDGAARNSLISDSLVDIWSNWVVIQNGTNLYFYKNGVFINSVTSVGNSFGGTCVIGSRYSKDQTFFNGRIDEVILWDRALTAEEVLDLFESSSKKIDLNLYSCSDVLCESKTSTQEILNAKNNYDYDLSLTNSRYFGWSAYLKPIDELSYLNNGSFSTNAFIQDINISIIK